MSKIWDSLLFELSLCLVSTLSFSIYAVLLQMKLLEVYLNGLIELFSFFFNFLFLYNSNRLSSNDGARENFPMKVFPKK